MRADLTQSLLREFPTLYPRHDPLYRDNPPPWNFDVGDGWYALLRWLSRQIVDALRTANLVPASYSAVQVKEKFGGLRFYADGAATPEFQAAIGAAEDEAVRTCERCGAPGRLLRQENGWWTTQCTKCTGKKEQVKSRALLR